MNAALRAHIHLLETWPRERITTHERVPAIDRQQGVRLGKIPRELIEEVWASLKAGRRKNEILAELRMGGQLFDKIHAILLQRLDAQALRQEIKRLSEAGLSDRRIAFALKVSRTTVQNHRKALNAADR